MHVMMHGPCVCQASEALAALHKTSQQVQKLAEIVSKGPPGAPLLRSPTQPLSQSGEFVHIHLLCIIHENNPFCNLLKFWVCLLWSRNSGAGSVCIPHSLSVHNPAEPKCVRGRAQSRDEHSGKETHQDLAQRDPRCCHPCWCVARTINFLFVLSKTHNYFKGPPFLC